MFHWIISCLTRCYENSTKFDDSIFDFFSRFLHNSTFPTVYEVYIYFRLLIKRSVHTKVSWSIIIVYFIFEPFRAISIAMRLFPVYFPLRFFLLYFASLCSTLLCFSLLHFASRSVLHSHSILSCPFLCPVLFCNHRVPYFLSWLLDTRCCAI